MAAIAFFAPRLSGGGDPTAAVRAAGCTAKTLADQGAAHIADLEQKVKYNSFPPTSGRHFQQPAIFGAYTEPERRERRERGTTWQASPTEL